jgi:hypothetical protein
MREAIVELRDYLELFFKEQLTGYLSMISEYSLKDFSANDSTRTA